MLSQRWLYNVTEDSNRRAPGFRKTFVEDEYTAVTAWPGIAMTTKEEEEKESLLAALLD